MADLVAKPASAVSAPQTIASAPASASVAVQAGVQTIAIKLQPEAKPTSWADPSVLGPAVAFLALLFSIQSMRRNLAQSAENTEKQLKAAAENLEKQLRAAAETTDRQLKATQDAADAKMAHDRDEARKIRLMNARRDIYVEIMADYQKVQQFIGGLANEDAKFEQMTLLSVMSASVNKLWIWGEIDTAYKMREFYTQVNEFYYAALARALAIKKTRDLIAGMLKHHALLVAKADDVGEELREINSQAENLKSEAQWQRTQERLNQERSDAVRAKHQWMKSIEGYSAAVTRKEDEYLEFVIERQTELNNQVNIVMASARADVGLEGETTKLDEQTHEMSHRVRDAVARYKKLFQAELRDMDMRETGE